MKVRLCTELSLLLLAGLSLGAADLEREFHDPPPEARPGVWWWWVNGNVSKEGVTRDLTEMAAKGIRSVDLFDVGGKVVGDVPVGATGMMSPAWRELFRYALQEAARLGIDLRITAAAGWGMGGPWVGEEHASKTLRSVEVQADGPLQLDVALPRASGAGSYYRDVAVLAFREKSRRPVRPTALTASSVLAVDHEMHWPVEEVADGDPNTFWKPAAPPSAAKPQWLQMHFPEPLTAASVLVAGTRDGGPRTCELQSSGDGKTFQKVAAFELSKGEQRRIPFAATCATDFRLVITSAHLPDIQLSEVWLLREGDEPCLRPGIKWWPFKSGNRSFYLWPPAGPSVLDEEYPDADEAADCLAAEVVDLTSKLTAEGHLRWSVPPGRWSIVRFGSVLLGEPPRAMSDALQGGYEPDCFSPAAAELMYNQTAALLAKDSPDMAGKTLAGIFVDSYEIGASVDGIQPVWTGDFREQFKRRRGYDPLPYFPALARRIVDGRAITGRFFWDYRQTLAELYNDFYARLTQLANAQGLRTRAECGYGTCPFPQIDGLAAFGRVDEVMGEFWFNRVELSQFFHWADSIRTAASAAHIYGKAKVLGESLTIADGRKQAPGEWKTTLDREFANGMNQPMLHVWSHQYDVAARPGLFTYGTVCENMTWWEQSPAFLDYLARCGYMLRRGLPVADTAYFQGEGTATFVPAHEFVRPALPSGYEFDGINAEVIEQRLEVKDGLLFLPGGIRYRYLVLPNEAECRITPRLLKRIRSLVEDGATVIGPRPCGSLGLKDFEKADRDVKRLADELWGDIPTAGGLRKVGRGRVIWGRPMSDILASDGVQPDVDVSGMSEANNVLWCHRSAGDTEIYFLSNQSNRPQTGKTAFRVSGKQPEFWDPLTGQTRAATEFAVAHGCTLVPLRLEPGGSVFVVFRKQRTEDSGQRTENTFSELKPVMEITGPWEVTFDPKWGGPGKKDEGGRMKDEAVPIVFNKLDDWSMRHEDGIRYYSGTAVYRTTFDVPSSALRPPPSAALFLDLGTVKNIAQVRLNGRVLGVVWTPPWRVDITSAVKPSGNELEITVANLWVNRLVGDESLPPEQRFTKTNARPFKKDTPLLKSGLLGPVRLCVSEGAALKD